MLAKLKQWFAGKFTAPQEQPQQAPAQDEGGWPFPDEQPTKKKPAAMKASNSKPRQAKPKDETADAQPKPRKPRKPKQEWSVSHPKK